MGRIDERPRFGGVFLCMQMTGSGRTLPFKFTSYFAFEGPLGVKAAVGIRAFCSDAIVRARTLALDPLKRRPLPAVKRPRREYDRPAGKSAFQFAARPQPL